jgi:hypothetical protein
VECDQLSSITGQEINIVKSYRCYAAAIIQEDSPQTDLL